MTTKTENGNFHSNFYFPVNKLNFLYIWDNLVDMGLRQAGWICGKSKYDALNDMVDNDDRNRAIEVHIDTDTSDCWFMVWCQGVISNDDMVDVDEVMAELPMIKKNMYKGNK